MKMDGNPKGLENCDHYPEGYSRMVTRLIKRIGGDGQVPLCWNDRREAFEALQSLDKEAENMRKESMHLAGVPNIYDDGAPSDKPNKIAPSF